MANLTNYQSLFANYATPKQARIKIRYPLPPCRLATIKLISSYGATPPLPSLLPAKPFLRCPSIHKFSSYKYLVVKTSLSRSKECPPLWYMKLFLSLIDNYFLSAPGDCRREGILLWFTLLSLSLLLEFWALSLWGLAAGYRRYMAHVWVRGLDDGCERGKFPRKSYADSGVEYVQNEKEKKRKNTRGVYGTDEWDSIAYKYSTARCAGLLIIIHYLT